MMLPVPFFVRWITVHHTWKGSYLALAIIYTLRDGDDDACAGDDF